MDAQCKYHYVVGNDYNQSCAMMQQWLNEQNFRRDQIISVTSALDNLEKENHVLVCFYKTVSAINEPVLSNITFDNSNPQKNWDDLIDGAEQLSKRNQIVSIGHTPYRGQQLQTTWMVPLGRTLGKHTDDIRVLYDDKDSSVEDFVRGGVEWLQKHVMPHQLTGISLFEEEHDPNTREYLFAIMHKAGDEPKPISEVISQEAANGNKYSYEIFKGTEQDDWRTVIEKANEHINRLGASEGHVSTISNFSFGQFRKVIVNVSWKRDQESLLVDQSRPEGCCAIF